MNKINSEEHNEELLSNVVYGLLKRQPVFERAFKILCQVNLNIQHAV